MEVAHARLGDPDVGAGTVDVRRQLVGDAGVDRVERERERQGQRDAADRGDEAEPVPGQVAPGEEERRAHPRKTSAGSRRATDRAGMSAASSAISRLLARTTADRRGLDRRRGTAAARP